MVANKQRDAAYYQAHREHYKAYRAANKDKLSAYLKEYNQANKEKLDAQRKAYREANKEAIKARNSAYRKANGAKIKAYRASNRDRIKAPKHEYDKVYYAANKERMRAAQIKYKYGLTPEELQEMQTKQNGVCALCYRVPTTWCVDHDHTTGKARGLLCNFCNTRLSAIEDSEFHRRALEYLQSNMQEAGSGTA